MELNYNKDIESFNRFLRNKGYKLTSQRIAVLKQVLNTDTHFNAEEIFDKVRNGRQRISRATVYRTLEQIEKCNLIRKLELGQSRAYYEQLSGKTQHEHIYCKECGKIIEFSDSILEDRVKEISGRYDVVTTNHSFQISGICSECSKKAAMREKMESVQ